MMSRHKGSSMIKKLCQLVSVALLSSIASLAQATKLDIVCPCEMRTNSQTSLIIKAGAINRETTTSGDLRFRIAAHTTPSFFDSGSFTIATHHLGTNLSGGSSFAPTEFKTGLFIPTDNTFFYSLVLEEFNGAGYTRRDFIRLRDSVTLNQDFGYAVNDSNENVSAQIFFDGTPTISVSGSSVAINLPPIVNNSPSVSTGTLEVSILQANGPSVFNTSFFTASSASLGVSLAPKTQTSASTVNTSFSEQSDPGFDYFHVRIRDGSNTRVFQTVRFDAGSITNRSFTVEAIEVLEDDDNDGVSNFNERLEGTSTTNANSKPGTSTIDAIFYYTQGAPGASPGGDVDARLDQIVTVTNQIFAASSTNVTIREVLRQQISLPDNTPLSSVLTMMEGEMGPFSNIRSQKTSSGADIAVVFLPFNGGNLCGLATLTGAGLEGDFAFSGHSDDANATVYIDCRDNVTAHEIGHVLGVTHSRIESRNEGDLDGGTFVWSVGHGASPSFVTVMANSDDFGGAPELNIFSTPDLSSCSGLACGVTIEDAVNGADATKTIDTVRFQVARFTPSVGGETDTDGDGIPDSTDADDDGDGVPDVADAFPTNSAEFADTDGDGTGNNADSDDDNDGVPDSSDAFPLDNTETTDSDGDGVGDNADLNQAIRLDPSKEIALNVIGLNLTSSTGGGLTVPANATAVSLNVTVVNPESGGFITVYPCGVSRPLASNVNYRAGQVIPNGVIAPIGSNGKVCLFSSKETDLVVDIAGWFTGESFTGATPTRLVDSRNGTGSPQAKLTSAAPLAVQITGLSVTTASGGSATIPTNISAASLNVTVVNPEQGGFITVYPCDVDRPLASNVNYSAGQVIANGVIAPVSASGEVCLFTSRPTDIVVDVAGWFGSTSFTGSTPSRLVDTRNGTGGRLGALTNTDELNVPVRGITLSVSGSNQSVPAGATAAALNVTAVRPEAGGFITVYPCGVSRPLASNLNYSSGIIVANNVTAPIGSDGSICIFTSRTTDIVVDVAGWFEGDSSNGFVGATPRRLIDTRNGTGPAPQ